MRVSEIGSDGYFTVITNDKRKNQTLVPEQTLNIIKVLQQEESEINLSDKRYNIVTIINFK